MACSARSLQIDSKFSSAVGLENVNLTVYCMKLARVHACEGCEDDSHCLRLCSRSGLPSAADAASVMSDTRGRVDCCSRV